MTETEESASILGKSRRDFIHHREIDDVQSWMYESDARDGRLNLDGNPFQDVGHAKRILNTRSS